jgi:hypothetical protein
MRALIIGIAELAGSASVAASDDFLAAIGSIFAVALGVLCGTQLEQWFFAALRKTRPAGRAQP